MGIGNIVLIGSIVSFSHVSSSLPPPTFLPLEGERGGGGKETTTREERKMGLLETEVGRREKRERKVSLVKIRK